MCLSCEATNHILPLHLTGSRQLCSSCCSAGCSVSHLRQESQPRKHAQAAQTYSIWSTCIHLGSAVQTILQAASPCVLGNNCFTIGIVPKTFGMGIELFAGTWCKIGELRRTSVCLPCMHRMQKAAYVRNSCVEVLLYGRW